MPRPKQRTPELRDRLLDAAVDMLARDGVAGFTTRRVAEEAATSAPAVYELFGNKAGLVREVFFEGFRLLRRRLDTLEESGDPRVDLVRLIEIVRSFVRENPVLADVMFSRPFADFDPGPSEARAGDDVREFIVERVRRCVVEGQLEGDPTDIAHVVLALTLGLADAEKASRLGTSNRSVDRRWALGVEALLDGLRPKASDAPRRIAETDTG